MNLTATIDELLFSTLQHTIKKWDELSDKAIPAPHAEQ